MNKFFIKRLSGIRLNAISSLLLAAVAAVAFFIGGTTTQAQADEAYTFEFHNQTQSLTGQTVNKNLTFQKMGYWKVKKATLNLNFQLSQLSSRQESDLTVAVNGVKVASFRPEKTTQRQAKEVELPVDLLRSTNTLQISGQILNKVADKFKTQETPANWLTIYEGANINFQYTEDPPKPSLKSFFQYFTGMDKITQDQSAVLVDKGADDGELTAALTALMSQSEMSVFDVGHLALKDYQPNDAHKYQVVVAKYADLPADIKKEIPKASVNKSGLLKIVYSGDKYRLVITAKTDQLLKKAAEFFVNHELMQERKQSVKQVNMQTKTFPAVQEPGKLKQQLTMQKVDVTGLGKQEQLFDVKLPVGQTQALGSKISLHYNYSPELSFEKSAVSVYVNDQLMVTKKLSANKTTGDSLAVKLPQKKQPQDSYQLKVVFDLVAKKRSQQKDKTWAQITPDSLAEINSQPLNSLLFDNFPGAFVKEPSLSKLIVARPKHLTATDLDSLSNIFTLIGQNINSAHGLEVATTPSKHSLRTKNIIAVGTPEQNNLIKKNNSRLYFKFAKNFAKFTSNEKLSVEDDWGQHIGAVQLLRSPYNNKRAFLVATAVQPRYIYLATQQLASAKNVEQYQNKDAFVVDEDNVSYSYRFKKDKILDHRLAQEIRRKEQRQMYIYLLLGMVAIVLLIGVTCLLVVQKNKSEKGRTK